MFESLKDDVVIDSVEFEATEDELEANEEYKHLMAVEDELGVYA